MTLISNDKFTIIVGLGQTGLSCARFLAARGERFGVVDTREQPPGLTELRELIPDVALELGPLQAETLKQASRLVLSPGIARSTEAIAEAEAAGVEVTGDIDLFCEQVTAPIVAITGSNAKSTVTTLLGEMAQQAGFDVAVGGNIGTPVLDLLPSADETREHQLYILELSSFQLELTTKLQAAAATVLNVSADHMDRYPNLAAYQTTKQRIYRGCRFAVFNADDLLTQPLLPDSVPRSRFGLGAPDLPDYGVLMDDAGDEHIAKGLMKLMPVSELKMPGRHNLANALAALALSQAVHIPITSALETLKTFSGLPHRCQWLRELHGVQYFNDSKGTNVGATIAAIEGLNSPADDGRLILLAGGEGKGADFSGLKAPLLAADGCAVLFGRDAELIAEAISPEVEVYRAESLQAAVRQAQQLAGTGDRVLLSPACASFDMFSGYEDRGEQFMQLVEALT